MELREASQRSDDVSTQEVEVPQTRQMSVSTASKHLAVVSQDGSSTTHARTRDKPHQAVDASRHLAEDVLLKPS